MTTNTSSSKPQSSVMNPNAYGRSYNKPNQAPPVSQPAQPNRVANPSPPVDKEKPKDSDPFAEIFGGNSTKSNKPTTMGDMRKEQMVKDNDPETVKVRLWSEGKTNNIRALLSTMDQVLWDEVRERWQPVPIHKLVNVNEVKKAYKKTVVLIHPDKLMGTEHEKIARLIFVELNEAWAEFENEAMAQS